MMNKAVVYARLSREDDLSDESKSITHQREIATEYCIQNGFRIVSHNGIYRCDDDNWSGYGDKIETIDELNKLYETYLDKAIIQLETILRYLKY